MRNSFLDTRLISGFKYEDFKLKTRIIIITIITEENNRSLFWKFLYGLWYPRTPFYPPYVETQKPRCHGTREQVAEICM